MIRAYHEHGNITVILHLVAKVNKELKQWFTILRYTSLFYIIHDDVLIEFNKLNILYIFNVLTNLCIIAYIINNINV